MSLDLDRIYESIAEQADRAELPPVQTIRRRARRRPARLVASTAAVLVLIAAAWVTHAGPMEPSAARAFLPFDGEAQPVVQFDDGVREAKTITLDDVTYVSWADMGQWQHIAAIDLETLRPLWGPVTIGQFIGVHDIQVSHGAVLTSAVDESAGYKLVALDPATGKAMWRLEPIHMKTDSRLLYDDVMILGRTKERTVEAVELKTGRTIWADGWDSVPNGLTAMRRTGEFREFGGYASLPVPADRRFVLRQRDGTVQVRNVDTGKVLRQFPTQLDPQARDLAVDGKLYSIGDKGITQLDLEGQGAEREIFDRADGLSPCGDALICLTGPDLVVIDPLSGQELWRKPANGKGEAVFSTDRTIVAPGPEDIRVYDLTGKQLFALDGPARWIDNEHLLVWGVDGLRAQSVVTGERTLLGRVDWDICSWNSTTLSCPTAKGVKVWRYRASSPRAA